MGLMARRNRDSTPTLSTRQPAARPDREPLRGYERRRLASNSLPGHLGAYGRDETMGAADMKRIRTVGLCLVAVFACSALAASSAMAGEYGKCVAVAKVGELYHGKWIDKACEVKKASEQEVAEGGKKNKYEWVSAAGTKFKSTSKLGTLSSAGGSITCRSSTAEGQVTGWQTGTETILFKECGFSATGGKCTSFVFGEKGEEIPTAPEGDIETFTLKTYLLDHGTKGHSGLEPIEGETWTELLAAPGNPVGIGAENFGEPLQAQYVCAPGVVFQTSGTLSGKTTPVSKMIDKFVTKFGAGGEQDLKTIAFEPGEVNTGPNVETTTGTSINVGLAKTEIRECNEVGATPEGKGAMECEHEEPQP